MGTEHGDRRWDGRDLPYIPPAELTIDPSLRFHDDVDDKVDPVNHEVLRHALWNVNVEHGNTIMKISGSPICSYGHDFNPSILDEKADFVFFGPFLQYLAAVSSTAAKWTLENRSGNPGIKPGDMFLTNDPWVGATHQADVTMLAPVFVDDRLFCWVANTLHQWDLGGTAPGGFNPIAEDVYWEPPCIPPVKIVEGGTMRRDIEEHFLRSSRVPGLVALDLRAATAGCGVARERILQLVERYGAASVKATMRKLQDDSESAFLRRLATIPDGTWTEEAWSEAALPGDRNIYRNRLTLTKKGTTLSFSSEGSADQQGTLSAGFGAWRGGVASMLATTLLFDQMFAIEGALRHCEFVPNAGAITCATRPAAVSGGPAVTLIQAVGLSELVISKMLATSSDPELRSEVQSCMGGASYPVNALEGIDQRGRPYSSMLMDPMGAALPALSWRDGQDTGGYAHDLQSTMPNVEENEQIHPMLTLWRKEITDSGGAGRYRGGNGGEVAFVPHKTDRINLVTFASEMAVPMPGLFGGYPSSTNAMRHVRGADVIGAIVAAGRMPTSTEELDGETEWVAGKSFGIQLLPAEAWVLGWASASGYGDPLERDPEAVRRDVADGAVGADWARRAYGVVLVGAGEGLTVDEEATAAAREEIRARRLSEGVAGPAVAAEAAATGGGEARPVAARIEWVDGELRADDVPLGPASGNYKRAALILDRPLEEANPNLQRPGVYVDTELAFRQTVCPRTGVLLQTEIAVAGAPPQWDVRLGSTDVRDVAAPQA
ncbi:MAG TPA: hydantoinase B/oxoprolinase family protein [Solirubrobacterales bacterium]|nr:hydantoinase B/oxoprolinase family protein [Solirubrobacterales bacterium]